MAIAKSLHGGRAQLVVDGQIQGTFASVSYGVTYDSSPIFLLGRFSAAEIVLSGMDAITVQASGFRIIDNGPFAGAKVPKLQDLLHHEDISLAVFDRQTDKQILTVVGVRPTGFSTSINSRGVADVSVTFMGLALSDESGDQDESPGASQL